MSDFGIMWDFSLECDREMEEDSNWHNTPEGKACHSLIQQENERLKALLEHQALIRQHQKEEREKADTCERCGEEVGTKLIGDEVYRNCPNCGTGISQ